MTSSIRWCAALAFCFSGVTTARAAESPPTLPPGVKQMVERFSTAFAAHDAKALAAVWTPDAQHIDMLGDVRDGRAAIEASYVELFKHMPDAKLSVELLSVRPVGDKVLLLDVIPTITPAPAGAPAEVRTSLVLVHENGQWLIQNARDTAVLAASSKQLEPLAWLEGTWQGTSEKPDKVAVTFECRWTGNKSFLLRTYTVSRNGVPRHGTEVIGWDAKAKTIRSWVFDSSGGFGERQWKRDKDGWLLTLTGASAEGAAVTAIDRLKQLDADRLLYDDLEHARAGQPQPDLEPVELTRVKKAAAGVQPGAPILPKTKPIERN